MSAQLTYMPIAGPRWIALQCVFLDKVQKPAFYFLVIFSKGILHESRAASILGLLIRSVCGNTERS